MNYSIQSTIYQDTVRIKFSEMPPIDIRHSLKSNGFMWSNLHRNWFSPCTSQAKDFAQSLSATNLPRNKIIKGDCVDVMQELPSESIDLVVTDPPYLVNYKDRAGRSIMGDNDDSWVKPAFAELYRLMKPNSFCVSFCGWNSIGTFIAAGELAGFRAIGHIIWNKSYASSTYYLAYHHEQAIILAKGSPAKPNKPLKSVLPWTYTGNKLHPTQKHPDVISPLIETFSQPNDIVLDPFCGSGTTLATAHDLEIGRAHV